MFQPFLCFPGNEVLAYSTINTSNTKIDFHVIPEQQSTYTNK